LVLRLPPLIPKTLEVASEIGEDRVCEKIGQTRPDRQKRPQPRNHPGGGK
jgi:hypothetical protein